MLKHKRGKFTSKKTINCIQQTIDKRKLTQEVLLNKDRGPEFVSKSYFEFINKQPFVVGSHSNAHTPTDNAVLKRIYHTLKNKVQQYQLPNSKAKRRNLKRSINTKVKFLNTEFKHKKNENVAALVLYNSQKQLERYEPEDKILKHEKGPPYLPFSDKYKQLMEYRRIVAEAGLYGYQTLINKIENMANGILSTVALTEENQAP